MSVVSVFASAALGAILQEVLYWYQIYKSLEYEKYQNLIKSRSYWIVVLAFVASSGLVALVWFDDAKDPPKLREVFVFGVSLPLIVKQFLKSRPENITLGAKSASYFDVR